MLTAIRQKVTVGAGGRIELPSSELPEGAEAELIVLAEIREKGRIPSLTSLIGAAQGNFSSPEEVDRYIRELRDS